MEQRPSNCLFEDDWWLDAVAPGKWQVREIREGSQVIARLPFILKKKWGLSIVSFPRMTPTLGPWLAPLEGKYCRQLARQKDLLYELYKSLPDHQVYYQNAHWSFQNHLPLYWRGIRQTQGFTYVLEDISDPDQIWSGFQENIRRETRKAEKQLKVRTDIGIDEFYKLNRKTFERQSLSIPYSLDFIRRIDNACLKRNSRLILIGEDAQGRCHGGLYFVWDERCAYYLMGGSDPQLRNSGVASLLMWEGIKQLSEKTKSLDLEGSMIEPIERFFRGLGGKQHKYSRLFSARPKPLHWLLCAYLQQ